MQSEQHMQAGQIQFFLQQTAYDSYKTELFFDIIKALKYGEKEVIFMQAWTDMMKKLLSRLKKQKEEEIDVDAFTQIYIIDLIKQVYQLLLNIVESHPVEMVFIDQFQRKFGVIPYGSGDSPREDKVYPKYLFDEHRLFPTYYVLDIRNKIHQPVDHKVNYSLNLPCHYMVKMVCILLDLIRDNGLLPKIKTRTILDSSIISGGINYHVDSLYIYNFIVLEKRETQFFKAAQPRFPFYQDNTKNPPVILPYYHHTYLELTLEGGLPQRIIFDPSNKQFLVIDISIKNLQKRMQAKNFLIPRKTSIVPANKLAFYIIPSQDNRVHKDKLSKQIKQSDDLILMAFRMHLDLIDANMHHQFKRILSSHLV